MVTPVELNYLLSLPLPNAVEQVSYDSILTERLAQYAYLLPAWSATPDSPLYKVAETESLREFTVRQIHNRSIIATLLPYATGTTLTQLALWAGLKRDEYSDPDLRLRIINRLRAHPGTRRGLISLAKIGSVNVADANVSFATNNRASTFYALGPGQVDLTAQELVDFIAWMNQEEHTILDVEAVSGAVTRIPLTIEVTARYFVGTVDGTTLAEKIRTAIYEWIDINSVLGNTIRKRSLEAAVKIPGVEFVNATAPADDEYVAAAGELYTFNKTSAVDGVVITVTAL